jgi:M6 family metalloprotease-like protein
MKKIITCLFFFTLAIIVCAAPLRNVPVALVQPNGDTLHCFASGDEFFNYLHDANGYTIMQDDEGWYMYAIPDGKDIKASGYIAGIVRPERVKLQKNVLPAREKRQAIIDSRRQLLSAAPIALSDVSNAPPSYAKNQGTLNNIVIFIRFSDDSDTPFSPFSVYEDRLSAGNASLQAFYKEVSYNLIDIPSSYYPAPQGNTVMSYKDVHPKNYYRPYSSSNPDGYRESERTDREQTLLMNAINAVSSLVPSSLNLDMNGDGYVDNVSFILSANSDGWNALLWAHRWSLFAKTAYINGKRVYDFIFLPNNQASTSTLCHEMFHALSAPDLYHYDDPNNLSPVGIWDIMEENGTPPQHMGAYMKYKYGNWISSIPVINAPGTYTLSPLSSSSTSNCYRIPMKNNSQQFYVVEYRKKPSGGFESSIPGSGMLVYRIDTRYNGNANYNGTNSFDEVYVFRPGGSPNTNGSLATANLGAHVGRTQFDHTTLAYPFQTGNGVIDENIYISDITAAEETISFVYSDRPTPVASIDILTEGPINIGLPQVLSAEILPTSATNKSILWTVTNGTGRARISGNNVIGETPGLITLTAEAQDGSHVSASKTIEVSAIPVTAISITTPDNVSIAQKQMPLSATVSPTDASNKTIQWSVENLSGKASVNDNLLLLEGAGTVKIKAAASDNSGVTAEKELTITEDGEGTVTGRWNNGHGADGVFTIESTATIKQVEIYSVAGAKVGVTPGAADALSVQIHFLRLPKGTYIVRVIKNNNSKDSKLKVLW